MVNVMGTAKEIPVDGAPGWMWRLEVDRQFGDGGHLFFSIEQTFRSSDTTKRIAELRDADGMLAREIMDATDCEPDELASEIMRQVVSHAFEVPPSDIVEAMSDHLFAWICEQRTRA